VEGRSVMRSTGERYDRQLWWWDGIDVVPPVCSRKQFESMEDHTSTLEVKAPSTPQPGPSQHQPNTQENDLPGARAARPPKTRPRG
jgi:hypothetical protein